MQEAVVHNCYFHYFLPNDKNGTGTNHATVHYAGAMLTVFDASGVQVYQFARASFGEFYISPRPGEPMLGVAQELMIFISDNEWCAVQPSEEDDQYIQTYERELNLLFDAMSGATPGTNQSV